MKHLTLLACLLVVVTVSHTARLPNDFKKCKKNQSEFSVCLSNAIEDAVRKLTKPYKEVGLPSLHPLEVPALTISAGQGAVSFQQNYKNLKVWGFDKIQCSKAEIDFEKKVIFVDCTTPLNRMDFDYEINGRLLLLPIFGKGPGSIILENLHETFTFNLEEYEKRNKKYYKVVNSKITMDPSLITFNLENLFNGNKMLGDNVLRVMNENWKEVFGDVKNGYEYAFAQIFSALFNQLLAKVPVEELFEE